MATIDDELARFEREIAAVEAAQPEEGQITTQGSHSSAEPEYTIH